MWRFRVVSSAFWLFFWGCSFVLGVVPSVIGSRSGRFVSVAVPVPSSWVVRRAVLLFWCSLFSFPFGRASLVVQWLVCRFIFGLLGLGFGASLFFVLLGCAGVVRFLQG